MRIHSDKVTREDVNAAAAAAGAYLDGLTEHGSRRAARAFEVKLRGSSARRPNFYNGDGGYAATWDQWGVFFGHLYRIDPAMVCDRTYANADDYNHKTFGRFAAPGMPADVHGDHKFDNVAPYVSGCRKCSAKFTWAS